MSMFEVPKMATHPLDKYRQASIDYLSGSEIFVTGNLYVKGAISGSIDMGGDAITASYVTGSIQVSGSIVYADKLSANFITGSSSIVSKGSISGSSVTVSGPVSGSSMWTTNFTGSRASITNLFVAGGLSGSGTISGGAIFSQSYQGVVVSNILASGATAPGANTITFTGSASIVVTQSGNVITITHV